MALLQSLKDIQGRRWRGGCSLIFDWLFIVLNPRFPQKGFLSPEPGSLRLPCSIWTGTTLAVVTSPVHLASYPFSSVWVEGIGLVYPAHAFYYQKPRSQQLLTTISVYWVNKSSKQSQAMRHSPAQPHLPRSLTLYIHKVNTISRMKQNCGSYRAVQGEGSTLTSVNRSFQKDNFCLYFFLM